MTKVIAAARSEAAADEEKASETDVVRVFEEVARVLADLDIQRAWAVATEVERRVLIDEFLQGITVLPDHLEVTIRGAPPLNVHYSEVGFQEPVRTNESDFSGVGGGT